MSCPIETQLFAALLLGLAACPLLARLWVRKVRARLTLASVPGAIQPGAGSLPRQLGPYTLANKLGQGAMGEVYRARHATLQRWCAIKLLRADASERERLRFAREAELTARLDHPNAVAVHDSGRAADGTPYLVLELLEGMNLQQLVERHGPQPPARVIQILLGVCAALSDAHGAGVIHRDIKPDNVMLCRKEGGAEQAKLLDFGLAKHVADAAEPSESANSLVGTPLYLSPEAITAPASVDVQADLYGLGAVAYFLLTGAPVFSGSSLVEVCAHHLHSTPEPVSHLSEHPVSDDLDRLISDCLAKDPLDRPASAAELARRLSRCADAASWSDADARRRWQVPASDGAYSYDDLPAQQKALQSTVRARAPRILRGPQRADTRGPRTAPAWRACRALRSETEDLLAGASQRGLQIDGRVVGLDAERPAAGGSDDRDLVTSVRGHDGPGPHGWCALDRDAEPIIERSGREVRPLPQQAPGLVVRVADELGDLWRDVDRALQTTPSADGERRDAVAVQGLAAIADRRAVYAKEDGIEVVLLGELQDRIILGRVA
jgi:serine/threonine protein kinase